MVVHVPWYLTLLLDAQLLSLQKLSGNSSCVDCGAPSPQWASPKFGTFICLSCAGIHRGLGVHISFVRSISMDSFKVNEVKRMEQGGNNAWKSFWEGHADGGKKDSGGGWNDLPLEEAIRERYSEETGEEYKERLSAKVDEREYVAVANRQKKSTSTTPRSATLPGGASPARSGSPAAGSLNPRKEKNEAYFAKLGNENMVRPAHLPPSQGGKYAGFGSEPPPTSTGVEAAMPGVDDFQKDPVAALTKGFGWFTSTVGKGAKTVNDGWIQPTAQKVSFLDFVSRYLKAFQYRTEVADFNHPNWQH